MADTFKIFKIQQANRKQIKPKCEKKKENISRMCSDQKCKGKNNSQNMCSFQNCQCNVSHKECFQFINYEYLKTTFKDYQNQNIKDLFQKVLASLGKIARLAVERYNNMLDLYETYSMPQPLVQVYKALKFDGIVQLKTSHELKNFCDKFPEHELPKLAQIPEYKQGIDKIIKQFSQLEESLSQNIRELFRAVIEQEKTAKTMIEKKNIEKHSKKSPQDGLIVGRSQSKGKDEGKK